MRKSKNSVLIIVEGEVTEPEIFRRTLKYFNENSTSDYYTFGTSVLKLFVEVKKITDDFKYVDDVDTKNILISLLKRKLNKARQKFSQKKIDVNKFASIEEDYNEKMELLERDFHEIFLVFDREPHVKSISCEKIEKIQQVFSNSTNNGLLLLSYPMVEAIKDISSKWIVKYFLDKVSLVNFDKNKYKRKRSRLENKNTGKPISRFNSWKMKEFYYVSYFNIRKTLFLGKTSKRKFYSDRFDIGVVLQNVLKKQNSLVIRKKSVYSLSTIPMILVIDYPENYKFIYKEFRKLQRDIKKSLKKGTKH